MSKPVSKRKTVKRLAPDVIAAAARLVADVVRRIDAEMPLCDEVLEALDQTSKHLYDEVQKQMTLQTITNKDPREMDNLYLQSKLLSAVISLYIVRRDQIKVVNNLIHSPLTTSRY